MQRAHMERAIRLSIENVVSGKGGPFAAIVVKGDTVLSEETNLVTLTNDPTAHAEIVALRGACKSVGHFELKGCELYSTCEPCPMCWAAIYWARISKVYYGNTTQDAAEVGFDDSIIEKQLRLPYSQRQIPAEQILRTEALEGFRTWTKKPDKILY
jgi:guanine deaminase